MLCKVTITFYDETIYHYSVCDLSIRWKLFLQWVEIADGEVTITIKAAVKPFHLDALCIGTTN